MHFTIERYSHSPKSGTFSILTIGDQTFDYVEQDWENNLPYESCIPNGKYEVSFYDSPHHGPCYILVNKQLGVGKYKGEATRFGCLIHVANLASQLQGCGAPGMRVGFYRFTWSVSSSGTAMGKILKLLGKKALHTVTISSNFPDFKEK